MNQQVLPKQVLSTPENRIDNPPGKPERLTFIVGPDPTQIQDVALWELKVAVADLICYPLSYIRLISRVGRFFRLAYEPYRLVDPELVVMGGPNGATFNRLVRELVSLRNSRPSTSGHGDIQNWFIKARPYINQFTKLLEALKADDDELELVMNWVTSVVVEMK